MCGVLEDVGMWLRLVGRGGNWLGMGRGGWGLMLGCGRGVGCGFGLRKGGRVIGRLWGMRDRGWNWC